MSDPGYKEAVPAAALPHPDRIPHLGYASPRVACGTILVPTTETGRRARGEEFAR